MSALKHECIKNERKNERKKERKRGKKNERKKEREKKRTREKKNERKKNYTMQDDETLIEKKITIPYPKKYSKSPSVLHSIRAICEKTPKSKSCKKSNLVGKKDDGTFIE